MQERLIVCCDGTWQTADQDYPTNIVKIAQGIKTFDRQGMPQLVYYDEGLGTDNEIDAILGGSFAVGLSQNIRDAYRFLCFNYDPGDEIYLFGFSRGAYTVRSLAGLISYCGLVERSHISRISEAYEIYRELDNETRIRQGKDFQKKYSYSEPAKITLLACWDTVGSVGIPDIVPILPLDRKINEKYGFHDTRLGSIIEHALHALAIDEDRKVFKPTFMNPGNTEQKLRQVWFPGAHACTGGGVKAWAGLSNATLLWAIEVIEQDFQLGLEFDRAKIEDIETIDPNVAFSTGRNATGLRKFIWQLTGLQSRNIQKVDPNPVFHDSVEARLKGSKNYRPDNLKPFFPSYYQ